MCDRSSDPTEHDAADEGAPMTDPRLVRMAHMVLSLGTHSIACSEPWPNLQDEPPASVCVCGWATIRAYAEDIVIDFHDTRKQAVGAIRAVIDQRASDDPLAKEARTGLAWLREHR